MLVRFAWAAALVVVAARPPLAATPAARADLRVPGRRVLIVTTASLPWMTGTAVNPLLRAAQLAGGGGTTARWRHNVTLMLPWVSPDEQARLGWKERFASRREQADFVRAWLRERVDGFDAADAADADARVGVHAPRLRLAFYDGAYHAPHGSIYPMGEVRAAAAAAGASRSVLLRLSQLTFGRARARSPPSWWSACPRGPTT